MNNIQKAEAWTQDALRQQTAACKKLVHLCRKLAPTGGGPDTCTGSWPLLGADQTPAQEAADVRVDVLGGGAPQPVVLVCVPLQKIKHVSRHHDSPYIMFSLVHLPSDPGQVTGWTLV